MEVTARIGGCILCPLGFPSGSAVKNLPAMQETWSWSLGWEDPLEECMAIRSSTLACYGPWGCKESDTTAVTGVACRPFALCHHKDNKGKSIKSQWSPETYSWLAEVIQGHKSRGRGCFEVEVMRFSMSGTGSGDRKLKQGHLDQGSFSVMGLMRESCCWRWGGWVSGEEAWHRCRPAQEIWQCTGEKNRTEIKGRKNANEVVSQKHQFTGFPFWGDKCCLNQRRELLTLWPTPLLLINSVLPRIK